MFVYIYFILKKYLLPISTFYFICFPNEEMLTSLIFPYFLHQKQTLVLFRDTEILHVLQMN